MATLTKYGHLGKELHPSLKGVLEAKSKGSESKPVDRGQNTDFREQARRQRTEYRQTLESKSVG